MNKRRAKQIALAIIATEDVTSLVFAQLDGANGRLDGLTESDKKRVVAAAEEIARELYDRAGEDAVDFVVGDSANGSS